MILLDSNILIYLRNPKYSNSIAEQFKGERLATCNVVIVEVLGYGELEAADALSFTELLSAMKNYNFDDQVTQTAIEIRKSTKIQLPDAIIAATALANNLTLWTHNTEDYQQIRGLKLFDPVLSS